MNLYIVLAMQRRIWSNYVVASNRLERIATMTYKFFTIANNGTTRNVYDSFNSEWAALNVWENTDKMAVVCGNIAYARLTCVETGEIISEY